MCAPCKIIIDGMVASATMTMDNIRDQHLQVKSGAASIDDDDLIYQMIASDVDYLVSVKKAIASFCETHNVPQRVKDQVARL